MNTSDGLEQSRYQAEELCDLRSQLIAEAVFLNLLAFAGASNPPEVMSADRGAGSSEEGLRLREAHHQISHLELSLVQVWLPGRFVSKL